jgi:Thymidylate synthase complementing protein
MTVKTTILLDSVNIYGNRITTFQTRIPTVFVAQLNKHGLIANNARSLRAVPTRIIIDEVRNDPWMPMFRVNKKGMGGGDVLEQPDLERACRAWLVGVQKAVDTAEDLLSLNVAKEVVNRVLTPFSHTDVVMTATSWSNFVALRSSGHGAQDEMCMLAEQVKSLLYTSIPVERTVHAPYVDDCVDGDRLLFAAARCARVSYKPFGSDKVDEGDDLRLAGKLLDDGHFSSFEHGAVACVGVHGRFVGWADHRSLIPDSDDFSKRLKIEN